MRKQGVAELLQNWDITVTAVNDDCPFMALVTSISAQRKTVTFGLRTDSNDEVIPSFLHELLHLDPARDPYFDGGNKPGYPGQLFIDYEDGEESLLFFMDYEEQERYPLFYWAHQKIQREYAKMEGRLEDDVRHILATQPALVRYIYKRFALHEYQEEAA